MAKKSFNYSMTHNEQLINSIEPNFVFSKNPINRFEINDKIDEKNNFNKTEQLNNLKKQINSILNCKLKENATNFVFGDGNINSSIMIIGEAPGQEEELSGKTFKDEGGKLLEKMLLAISIKKPNIYATYAINFRTPEDRKPTSYEIKRYSVFLKEHIKIIDPKIIILFGSTAMESITSSNSRISSERGKWKEIILKNKTYPLMVTFSPSYLIRFPENKKYSWEDLKKIKQKILDLKIQT